MINFQKFIQQSKKLGINKEDENGNTILLCALSQDNVLLLNYLLEEDTVDFNHKNKLLETPLIVSIRCKCSYETINKLIEVGCDINAVDHIGVSPLHEAITRRQSNIAQKLIERGANINSRDCNGNTPLFHAIDCRNLENFCMLLYYGADVNIQNRDGMTALTYALHRYNGTFASILLPYYDDFNLPDFDNYLPLHLALEFDMNLAMQLVELGSDVNSITCGGYCALEVTLMHETAELFQKIWPKINYEKLLKIKIPLLCTYLIARWYLTSEWVECLYLILQCPVAFQLVRNCDEYLCLEGKGFLCNILSELYKRNVAQKDRTNIISICLTFSPETNLTNLDIAIKYFGFNDEFEFLIYSTENFAGFTQITHPLFHFILGLKGFNIKKVVKLFNAIKPRSLHDRMLENMIICCLGFFAISHSLKNSLLHKWRPHLISYQKFAKKMNVIPEFPTLFELSRNKIHKLIVRGKKFETPYGFHDIIKRLNVPECIKDVIRFKKPIYQ